MEYKVIDTKSQGLLAFAGLLWIVISTFQSQISLSSWEELWATVNFSLISLAAVLALSSINLIGGHTRKIRDFFSWEYMKEEDRIADAHTMLASIAAGRRRRYLAAFWLIFISIGSFVSFAIYKALMSPLYL